MNNKNTQSFDDNFENIIEDKIEFAKTVDLSVDGKAIIEVSVNDPDDFFSPYSVKGDELINPSLNDYIAECENNIPINKKLKVNFYVNNDASDKVDIIKKTYRSNYADKVASKDYALKKNLIVSLFFLIFGISFLTLFVLATQFAFPFAVICICEIISWVFLWEFVDQIVIVRSSLRLDKKRYYRLLTAEVSVRTKAY